MTRQRALVVGAGPAGLSAATHLASWCDEVQVIESRPRSALRHTGEHLPPPAVAALRHLGLGDLLEDPHHPDSSGVCSAWGAAEIASKEYFFTTMGNGKTLRRGIFDAAMTRSAESRGVRLCFDSRLADLTYVEGRYDVTRKTEGRRHTESYDIVIDASGRNARAARLLGGTLARADALVGISGVVTVCRVTEDPGRLYIEAVEDGWWYGVQYADGQMICTFMTDAATLSQKTAGALVLWQDALRATQVLAALAQTGTPPDFVQVFDACTQALEADLPPGFLAVGDAATAFDPLSSWGIAKGLMDGHHGAQALQHGRQALAAYSAARHAGYGSYRAKRTEMYRMEQRWPHSEFWQSRHRDAATH